MGVEIRRQSLLESVLYQEQVNWSVFGLVYRERLGEAGLQRGAIVIGKKREGDVRTDV